MSLMRVHSLNALLLLHLISAFLQTLHLVLLMPVLFAVVVGPSLLSLLHSLAVVSAIVSTLRLGRWYNWIWIVDAETHIVLELLELGHLPRFMHEFGRHILEFRKPTSYVVALSVVVLALFDNVEAVQAPSRHAGCCAPVLQEQKNEWVSALHTTSYTHK